MAPKSTNGELIDHRLTEVEKKLDSLHTTVHDPEKGLMHRMDEVEEVTGDVTAAKAWAQRLGLAGLSAAALAYYDALKGMLPKIGGH